MSMTDLLAAGVEGLLQQASGLGDEALLHGGEVVRVLQGDLEPLAVGLQGVEEVLGEPACTNTTMENRSWTTFDLEHDSS